jgi:hypothetical protein
VNKATGLFFSFKLETTVTPVSMNSIILKRCHEPPIHPLRLSPENLEVLEPVSQHKGTHVGRSSTKCDINVSKILASLFATRQVLQALIRYLQRVDQGDFLELRKKLTTVRSTRKEAQKTIRTVGSKIKLNHIRHMLKQVGVKACICVL